MPMSDNLKRTVWVAVHDFERTLTPTYPRQFPNIDAAKLFVQKLCDAEAFDYGLPSALDLRPTDPHHLVRTVKDRAAFLIALRAHEQGEFYLDEALPDRRKLRGTFPHISRSATHLCILVHNYSIQKLTQIDAIEAEIPRLTKLVQTWPPTFANADVAAKYVAGVAALRQFDYTCFEGVSQDKFRAYVTWNTARRAWEGKRFEMDNVPRGWKRRAPPPKSEKCNSMTGMPLILTCSAAKSIGLTRADAIESDITRLRTLIPRDAWPTSFTDLNAARNFVGQWCYDNHFRYAGWLDVELRKYRLFVNFNAAKYALEDGIFEVERAVPPLVKNAKDHRKKSAVRKDEVAVIEMKAPIDDESEDAPVFDLDGYDRSSHDDGINSASASPSTPSSSFSSEIDAETAPLTPASPEPEKEVAPADPFKDLIAELQRGYILKVAFE